jgi:protein TonB
MEDRKIIFFIILSFLVHIGFFYLFHFEKAEPKNEKPTYVDIIKKEKKETQSEKKDKPDILSDKDIDLKKKTDVKKDDFSDTKKEIKSSPAEKYILPEKPQNKIVKEENVEKKIDKNEIKETISKEIAEKKDDKIFKDEQNKREENNANDKQISILDNKSLIKNILNPGEIINDVANYNLSTSREGEDDVNFNSMKFKYASYFYKFKRRLYNVWTYPSRSVMNYEEGTVRIKFSILKDGTITNIQIVSSSGYPDLDNAAVNALNTMGKVPLSDSFDLERLNVDGYFSYKLGFMGIY